MDEIDFSESVLILDGTDEERAEKKTEVLMLRQDLMEDRHKRRPLYKKRFDFYTGQQDSYTTIRGKVANPKEGEPSAVFNYAGKSAKKIAYSLANNPPKTTIPARSGVAEDFVEEERLRGQATENFTDQVFDRNMFWHKGYRRGVFNQVVMADAAIKTYPFFDGENWDIKVMSFERMDNVMVAWRGDDITEYDAVLVEEKRTIASVEKEFGIKIPKAMALKEEKDDISEATGSSVWADGEQWDGKGERGVASGETKAPSIIQLEYDTEDYYCILINGHFIQFVYKDDVTYPKIRFWDFVHNTPQPRSPWSLSDLDDMIEPQIEFNEASNDERQYIRVGAAQKFVAYNMDDFNPESIKTGSGGVIFVDNVDGLSRFEPLPTNVNVFPIDSYLNRVQSVLFDMGVPKVAFGSAGSDSGRSKAIDYQSLVELISFKQDDWELALTSIIQKIQKLGNFYFDHDYFKDPATGEFLVRNPEFDWNEVMPITQADKVVNVLNKVTMGLPFSYAFKELGYRDVEAVIAEMKRETKDPELMAIKAKMFQVTEGLVGAQARANQQLQAMEATPPGGTNGSPDVNTPTPTMTPQAGGEGQARPVAQRGGTTSYSTPKGLIDRARQNLQAQGG